MKLVFFHKITMVLLSGMIIPAVSAQYVSNHKRTADQFYAKGDYYTAAQYYEKSLEQKGAKNGSYEPYQVHKQGAQKKSTAKNSRPEMLYRLGESYRNLNDHTHAAQWYKTLLQEDATTFPVARYHYGVSLRANGNFKEAQEQLEQFTREYKQDDAYLKQAKKELENLRFIQQQLAKSTVDIKVEKLATGRNHNGADYAAALADKNTIVFTSTYAEANASVKMNALYSASMQGSKISSVEKFVLPAGGKQHEGAASFSGDGNRVFFTRWEMGENGKNRAAIYTSTKNNGNWSEPVILNNQVNAPGTDNKQPCITADGKYLLFSSNRSGGVGSFDIWYVPLNNRSEAGKAVNIQAVNTVDDDESPFYHTPGRTLVFSSNGRTGMGGFDLFETKGDIGSAFSQPVNLGHPVNSVKDDLYFVSRGNHLLENAFVSSDRLALCCLELFSVDKTYRQYYSGMVVDCETKLPLEGVAIAVTTGSDNKILTTNAEGMYAIETMAGSSLQIKADKTSYVSGNSSVPAATTDTVMVNTICLVKKADPFKGKQTLVTQDIYFKFNKTAISPDSYSYLDEMVAYLKDNPEIRIEVSAHTDGIGTKEYNNKLSQGRAEACADYLTKAGIESTRIIASGKGECCPLEKETTPKGKDNPEARQKNRRVEFKILQ